MSKLLIAPKEGTVTNIYLAAPPVVVNASGGHYFKCKRERFRAGRTEVVSALFPFDSQLRIGEYRITDDQESFGQSTRLRPTGQTVRAGKDDWLIGICSWPM